MHLEILSLNHSPIALLSILYIAVGGFFLTAVHRLFFHPLAKIPGPYLARLTRFWHTYHYASGNWHDVSHDLHKKYGPIVRIAPDEISFVDAVASKRLYSYARAAPKTKWYHTWTIPGKQPSFFAVTNNKEHARRRRQVATAYSMTSALAAESLMQGVTDVCWERFHRMAASPNKRLDLGFWATGYAYDIVGELAFGKSLKIMETGKDQEGIIGIVHGAFKIMASSGHLPGQTFWFFNPLIQLLLSYLGEDPLTKLTNNVTDHILERRKRGLQGETRRDMIQQFLESKTDEGLPLPEEDIRSEAMNMMSAGADTTSIAINAIISYLLQNPEKMTKVQEEIDTYYKKNNLPDQKITYNQCLEMPFLQAVIKESMRLHPSIQFQIPRLSPPEGITIAGYFIPGNYAVGINPKSHNRSKEIFGDDAEEWRPERWLEDEEKAKSMDSLLATWGFGSRTCVGKNIALVELNMFIAQFLRQFDVFVVDKENPFTVFTMWFSMQKDFWVTLRARDVGKGIKSNHA